MSFNVIGGNDRQKDRCTDGEMASIKLYPKHPIKQTNSKMAVKTAMPTEHTHTHTTILRPWILSGTTQVSRKQKGKNRKAKPIWIYWSKR